MRILFFAHVKDITGCGEVEWHLEGTLDADGFWRRLLEEFPLLATVRRGVRLAKNLEYAAPDVVFADQDEVALIPPVSGG